MYAVFEQFDNEVCKGVDADVVMQMLGVNDEQGGRGRGGDACVGGKQPQWPPQAQEEVEQQEDEGLLLSMPMHSSGLSPLFLQ